jgi:GPH family glycoside/pentoside/hexuronide:cation symporter
MALWAPPKGLGEYGLFTWFLIFSVMYLTCYAAYNVPYQALGLEMSADERDRASLAGYRAAANNLAWMAILPFLPLLVTNQMLAPDPVTSVGILGVLVAGGLVVLGLSSVALLREPPATATVATHRPAIRAGDALRVVLRDIHFLQVAGVMCLALIGFVLAMTMPYFVNLSYVLPGGTAEAKAEAVRISTWSSVIGNLLAIFFCPWIGDLAARFGRRQVLIAGLVVLMVSFLSTPWLFTPEYPWLQVLYKIIDTPAIAIVWVLTMPMLAEVCDRDEILHGVRREGVYTAMFNWGNKASMALVAVLGGWVIDASGFNGKLPLQTPETISFLRWAFVIGPIPFLATAAWLAFRFPLSSEGLRRLRAERSGEGTHP